MTRDPALTEPEFRNSSAQPPFGYKMAKYIMRIDAVESVKHIAGGRGSYWADRDYEWYAGI